MGVWKLREKLESLKRAKEWHAKIQMGPYFLYSCGPYGKFLLVPVFFRFLINPPIALILYPKDLNNNRCFHAQNTACFGVYGYVWAMGFSFLICFAIFISNRCGRSKSFTGHFGY